MEILFWLLVGHAVADFALQSGAMAVGKSRHHQTDGDSAQPSWYYWLTAHSVIHGGAVALATGVWWLGVAEIVVHWIADYAKCEGWTNIHGDQGIHVVSKIAWWMLIP